MLTRLLLSLLALLQGCTLLPTGTDQTAVDLRIHAVERRPGPEPGYVLSFSVRNSGTSPVGVSRCGDSLLVELQRRTAGEWLNAAAPICPAVHDMSPLLLEPGDSREGRAPVRGAGVYRVLLGVDDGSSPVASPSFAVE